MTTLKFLIVSLLSLAVSLPGQTSDGKNVDPNTLFSSTEPIELIIELDMDEVLNDTSEYLEYRPALLIQKLGGQQVLAFDIKIRSRGNTRRIKNVCEFPPLKINFQKKSTKGTVFQGQDKIKMVTHCRASKEFENYAILEYLVYKTYNILTDLSYRVRLVHVVYRDVRQKYPEMEKYGFFIEDDDLLADRIGGMITDKRIWSPDSCEQSSLKLFALFQFMIGNTDWWIHTRHNVDLIQMDNQDLIPLPYDFDYAGIINAPYATPSYQLPIFRVRDRFFKGSCADINRFEETIKLFNERKNTILSMVDDTDELERRYRKTSVKYLEEFYKIINDPDKFSKYLNKTCEFVNTIPDKAVVRK